MYEPPQEPIIRIETGMHIAPIRRISIDNSNRYLVTCSWDKTVRVWNLSTGNYITTLRPPIGDGSEGRLDSVAISPDGKTVACGGYTGWNWDYTCSIYIFDIKSKIMIHRITKLPTVITHLTYSKDGKYLVATFKLNFGMNVYSIGDSITLLSEDRDYSDDTYGADFSKDGRLATVSYDGFVRLYNIKETNKGNTFQLIAKNKTTGGARPYSVNFSPDGSKIAVGFDDSPNVEVISSNNLSHLYICDSNNIRGSICSVIWSSDGKFIYGGGSHYKDDSYCIRKWDTSNTKRYTDIPSAESEILNILPLNDGGIVFASIEPSFGVINSSDERVFYKTPRIADYRDNLKGFLVSYKGDVVQFSFEKSGKSPGRFSVINRLLETDLSIVNCQSSIANLIPPITSGLNITDWENSHCPKLNEKKLYMEKYEFSTSLAISPGYESFLLGTFWYLRFFDNKGNLKWYVPVSIAHSVNISGDGKLAIAALGDGTIRWYRTTDGKEILSLLLQNDKKHWIIWTPSGYYDCSSGSEELIGLHINQGKDKSANFFYISRYKEKYYRPDIISKVIDTLDEDKAIY